MFKNTYEAQHIFADAPRRAHARKRPQCVSHELHYHTMRPSSHRRGTVFHIDFHDTFMSHPLCVRLKVAFARLTSVSPRFVVAAVLALQYSPFAAPASLYVTLFSCALLQSYVVKCVALGRTLF